MITIDEKQPKGQDAPPVSDPWEDWKPQWTGRRETPHDAQEKHSPTEPVAVRLTAEKTLHKSQRRIVDARLWEQMTPEQQDAALAIAAAFSMIGRGLGYVTSDWQRLPGCRGAANIADAQARLVNFYIEWSKECARAKISHAMVVDVLCFSFPCRLIDRDRRLKTGTTRQNLMEGLTLYGELRGWI